MKSYIKNYLKQAQLITISSFAIIVTLGLSACERETSLDELKESTQEKVEEVNETARDNLEEINEETKDKIEQMNEATSEKLEEMKDSIE